MTFLLRCARRVLPARPAFPRPPRAPHNLTLQQWRRSNSTLILDLPVSEQLSRPPIWKHVAFAVGVSGSVLLYAAYRTEGATQKVREQLERTGLTFSPRDMRTTRRIEYIEKLRSKLANRTSSGDEEGLTMKLIWANILMPWHNLTEEQRTKIRIIALCTGVWVLWQVPGLGHLMRRSFTHDPLSGRRYTMLTSTFSHRDFFHGAINGVVFASFALPVMGLLDRDDLARGGPGRVQVTPVYEFAGLLVASGLASALASHVWATRVLLPRAVRALGDKAPTLRSASAAQGALETHAIAPSLGISGSVYAMFTLVALGSPSSEVSIVFLPFFSFPISWGFAGMLGVDALGLVRGWRMLDHAGHLGGAAFGAAWHFWGGSAWQAMRAAFRKDKQERAAQPPVNSFARN